MNDVSKTMMSEHDARKITERIRIVAHNYTEAKAKLIELVQQAKDGSAHEALGYPSWTAYLAETLGDEPMRLARDERQEMVKVLSAEGMSTRAIAPVIGATHTTVRRDLEAGGTNVPPEPKSDAELLAGAEWSPEAVEDEPRFTDEPGRIQPVTGTITGMDGKNYTRPQPKPEPPKPRRNPLPEQARTAGWEVRKSVERIERIMSDDRFTRNKEEVATSLRGHLQYAIETLQATLDQLN